MVISTTNLYMFGFIGIVIFISIILKIIRYVKWKKDRDFMREVFFKNNHNSSDDFMNISFRQMNDSLDRMNMENERAFNDFSMKSVTPFEQGGFDHSNNFNNLNQF